ncbi:MAG: hypothetical protein KAX39_01150 [candidate division Zixibacteria bacterium]|nr:hypothetical protein [candidate division Zixibacteria bacterium]
MKNREKKRARSDTATIISSGIGFFVTLFIMPPLAVAFAIIFVVMVIKKLAEMSLNKKIKRIDQELVHMANAQEVVKDAVFNKELSTKPAVDEITQKNQVQIQIIEEALEKLVKQTTENGRAVWYYVALQTIDKDGDTVDELLLISGIKMVLKKALKNSLITFDELYNADDNIEVWHKKKEEVN